LLLFFAFYRDIDAEAVHGGAGDVLRNALTIGYLSHDHDLAGVELGADAHGQGRIGFIVDDIVDPDGDIGLKPIGRAYEVVIECCVEEVIGF